MQAKLRASSDVYRRPTRDAFAVSHTSKRSRPRGSSWETISPAISAPSSSRVSSVSRSANPASRLAASAIAGGARRIHARLPTASRDEPHEVLERQPRRSRGIEHEVALRHAGLDADRSRVANGHELHLVAAVARDEEERHVPQPPRDVVDEHVVGTEDERRTDDRVGEARLAHDVLGLRLAAEVGKRGRAIRVRDAHVHHAPDARSPGRVDQPRRVRDRAREGHLAALEANPVRVVERVGAAQARHERVVEDERRRLDLRGERMSRVPLSRERAYTPAAGEQLLGDVPAGERERAGDDIERRSHLRISRTTPPSPRATR